MKYLGDFVTGATVRFMWNTSGVDGASVNRSTDGTVQVYKNLGTTQSTSGVTDSEAFDGLAGVHACAIDLSSDGTFYSAGADFTVVLSGATIDGASVNAVLAEFSIENRNIKANVTHVAGTSQTARDLGASVLLSSGTGTGQLDFTSGVVKSNMTQMGGTAQSATDLKDFADTGYDPSTHKVAGVVLTDTCTTTTTATNLTNAPTSGDLTAAMKTSVATAALTTAVTESYASDGAAPTLAQALCMLISMVGEFSISGTTLTCKKLDGSTTSMTFTLDDGTNPTSRTRSA